MRSAIDTVLIVHLSRAWRTFHRRHMLLALAGALPRTAGMICVDRPITFDVTPWKYPRKFWIGIWRMRPKCEQDGGLWIITPRVLLHDLVAARIPWSIQVNRRLLASQLAPAVRRLFPSARNVVQWIYHPVQRWVFGALEDTGRIYECYDDHSRLPLGVFDEAAWQSELETLRSVDLTFVTTQGLMQSRRLYSSRLELLPNGVADFFFAEMPQSPDTIDNVPRPRIGYLGNARSIVNFEILEEVFRRRSEWNLVFVGPVERWDAVRELKALRNVHFLGTRPHEQIPGILRRFDAGLVPLRDNEFTRVMSTLKLCEYLAAGVPVVATDLPELRRFVDVVRLAPCNALAFEDAIKETLLLDRSALSPKLIEAARPYSWNTICRQQVVPVLKEVFQI